MIFHWGALQKLCLKNAEILESLLLLWPKIQNAREASHHLTLTDNCQAFYLNVSKVPKCKGTVLLVFFNGPLNSMLGGDYFIHIGGEGHEY